MIEETKTAVKDIYGNANQHPAWKSFIQCLHRRNVAVETLTDAWYWYSLGWEHGDEESGEEKDTGEIIQAGAEQETQLSWLKEEKPGRARAISEAEIQAQTYAAYQAGIEAQAKQVSEAEARYQATLKEGRPLYPTEETQETGETGEAQVDKGS